MARAQTYCSLISDFLVLAIRVPIAPDRMSPLTLRPLFPSNLCYVIVLVSQLRTQREGALPWNGQHLSTKKSI
jgi:hypothetical protein